MSQGWEPQRAAASKNEQAIIAAATELFARRGVASVDVREIAEQAGVGVGTVYRRFGDKAALLAAVIGGQERELQDMILRGAPPLGPGAPADERLIAFLRALCRLTEANVEIAAASEAAAPGARYRIGAYHAWHLHVTVLLADIDPSLDADWWADLLLAPLTASLYRQQREQQGMSAARIADNIADVVNRLLRSARRPRSRVQPPRSPTSREL
jgi:AcrR family transcriptional regulator